MIVEAFLRWSETARVADRARAANALGRAYLRSELGEDERQAALMAMTHLLDDPSPKVRLALAEALAGSHEAPRSLILPLAEDQPEIAATVITRSPVIDDEDFIDLAARGDSLRRSLIASRATTSAVVSAAIAAVGDEPEVLILLENPDNRFAPASLRDIARRHGESSAVRRLLLERGDLPADARLVLMQKMSEALSACDLVRATVAASRAVHLTREAAEAATLAIAGQATERDIPALVEHLRAGCRLTPAFLMHALCAGRVDFMAGVLVNLSGVEDRRVRAVLSTSRAHAVRALFEAAGLRRELSTVFAEATLLLRKSMQAGRSGLDLAAELATRFRKPGSARDAVGDLLDMVEKLAMLEQRQQARNYAEQVARAA